MDKLEKKKYCIIFLENTEGMRDKILSIAVDPYKYIKGNNMLIVTFTTFISPIEMKEVLGSADDKTYFLFEMNSDSAMVSISDDYLEEYLFSDLINPRGNIDVINTIFGPIGLNNLNNNIEKKELHRKSSDIGHFNQIIAQIKGEILSKENKLSEYKLSKYSKEERDELVDELLEKGTNLTEDDKEVLNFLINKKD